MKFSTTIAVFCSLQSVSAHYVFSAFIVNETVNDRWKYVRRVSPNTTTPLGPHAAPHYDISSPNFRCGRDATTSGPGVADIATVVAGEKVGFRVDLWNAPMVMIHDGPLIAYLSRSPEQTKEGLQRYQANGEWFKIAEKGPWNKTTWYENYNKRYSEFNFTIPATTPPGLYLLRPESIYPSTMFNRTQFYMNCAHVEIVGPGNPKTEPGPMVKFPGAYSDFDEGIWIPNFSDGNGSRDMSNYKIPGPALWKG